MAYRTIGNDALDVITGIAPVHLLVRERMEMQTTRKDRKTLKEELLDAWQSEWTELGKQEKAKCKWTRRIIKDIKRWHDRSYGELNFQLTQLLSGHGGFGRYLYNIGKLSSDDKCLLCGGLQDNAEHTYFACSKIMEERVVLEVELGSTHNQDNLVDIMLENRENWKRINNYVQHIFEKRAKEFEAQKLRERMILH
ncbi:uncharacterized protein [Bemisia tabaci]|uniref:uncharacterized protein n=1 Tax=Bemisia tabaci TaxID=7038 RepID=UPI003B287EAF